MQLNQLRRSQELKGLVKATEDPFTEILEELGLSNIDFDIGMPSTKVETAVTEAVDKVISKEPQSLKDKSRKIVLYALLQKNEAGEPLYTTPKQIYFWMRREEYEDGKDDEARSLFNSVKSQFTNSFRKTAQRLYEDGNDVTVKRVLEYKFGKDLENVTDEEYKFIYKQMIDEYGDLTSEDFLKQVINRFRNKRKYEQQNDQVYPDITPKQVLEHPHVDVAQITLANRLIAAIDNKRIQEMVGEENFQKIINSGVRIDLDKNRIYCAEKRGNLEITKEEAEEAKKLILMVIDRLTSGPLTGWHQLDESLTSFIVLFEIMKTSDLSKGNTTTKIADLLFPKQTYDMLEDGTADRR